MPTCAASRPGASTSSSSRSAFGPRVRRSRAAADCSMTRSRPSASARSRAATPSCSSTPRSRRSVTGAGWWGVRGHRPRRPRVRTQGDHRPRRRGGPDRGLLARVPGSLVARGLVGVELAISDAHPGLKAALARLSEAISELERPLPKVAAMLERAEEDVLAFYAFPQDHWRKLRSANPLERFNREIGRRTDVVGIFPDERSLIRLTSMLAIEANDCHEGGGSSVVAV